MMPTCGTCGSREWSDSVSIAETVIVTLKLSPDGGTVLERTGRKYNEERDMDWQCINGHATTSDEQRDALEELYEKAVEA